MLLLIFVDHTLISINTTVVISQLVKIAHFTNLTFDLYLIANVGMCSYDSLFECFTTLTDNDSIVASFLVFYCILIQVYQLTIIVWAHVFRLL